MTDDLDAFSDELFGQSESASEQASPDEDEDAEQDDSDANDDSSGEDDTPAPDEDEDTSDEEAEDEDDSEEEEPEPEPKPKKSRFQERIDELTSKAREAERERDALLARLEKLEQNDKPTPAQQVEAQDTGPNPEDKNEDGTDKYPLGEFDPTYIRDLTRHTLQQEREAAKAEEAKAAAQKEAQAAKTALEQSWQEKLGPAQERYPDFREKGEELISSFDGIDQNYGEYLTATIMSMDYGTDVLYYLASNPDEAKKIVSSGAAKATIALGRLEAKFADADEEKQKARPKVSKAPAPPSRVNKGSAVVKPDVPDDTDDLDAFANKLFKPKKRRA